jgi:hypothetical protein
MTDICLNDTTFIDSDNQPLPGYNTYADILKKYYSYNICPIIIEQGCGLSF